LTKLQDEDHAAYLKGWMRRELSVSWAEDRVTEMKKEFRVSGYGRKLPDEERSQTRWKERRSPRQTCPNPNNSSPAKNEALLACLLGLFLLAQLSHDLPAKKFFIQSGSIKPPKPNFERPICVPPWRWNDDPFRLSVSGAGSGLIYNILRLLLDRLLQLRLNFLDWG
jgi:hypothetical protein